MAKLILSDNEYTVSTLLEYIKKKFKTKTNGSPFSKSDIHDWANKGKLPKQYGGGFVESAKVGPLKILRIVDQVKLSVPFEIEIQKQ